MYRAFVKHKARGHFANLSAGEWQKMTRDVADDVHHIFPGDHPLGGERHSRAAVERWFERLYRLYPQLEFDIQRVVSRRLAVGHVDRDRMDRPRHVRGWRALSQQRRSLHPAALGQGRLHPRHLDTQEIAASCERMAAAGIEEAAAQPITD